MQRVQGAEDAGFMSAGLRGAESVESAGDAG